MNDRESTHGADEMSERAADSEDIVVQTVGDMIDIGNDILLRNVSEDVAVRVDPSTLPASLEALVDSEHLALSDADLTSHVLEQLGTNPDRLNETISFLRSLGQERIAAALEGEIQAHGRIRQEFIDGMEADMAAIATMDIAIKDRLMNLLNPTTRPPAKSQASAELRGVLKDMGIGQPIRKNATSIGRNDSCPCGSGRKYKKCCLRKK